MSEKNTAIFREKSLKRISSPEDLDKYIKTTTPSMWLLLISIILFLVGIITWSVVGKIETRSTVGSLVEAGKGYSLMKEADIIKITDDSFCRVENEKCPIINVEGPYEVTEEDDAYLLHAAGLDKEDQWYYVLTYKTNAKDGTYKADIVFETISPITFIIN